MLKNIRINRKFWVNLISFIGAVFIIGFLFKKYRVAPEFPYADLHLTTTEGTPVNLSGYKGKTLVINFWATWCPDCRKEMPSLEKARRQLDSTQVVFLCVSDDAPEKVEAFQDEKNYGMTFLISAFPLKDLGINTLPTTYIINPEGHVEHTEVGATDWSSEKMLDRLR